MRGGKTPLNSNSYDDLQHLVVDTSLFSATFQSALISALSSSLGDFDSHINGTLIHSDNFQALNLLQARYREQVKCIYIDPPYNTGNDGFIYKDGYQHSSWLSLIYSRLDISKYYLSLDGAIYMHIDDNEQENFKMIGNEIFGKQNFVADIPWRKRTAKSDVPFGISQDYEHILAFARYNFIASVQGKDRKYYETDDFPNRPWRIHDCTKQTTAEERPNSFFTMIDPKTGKKYPANPQATWRVSQDTFQKYYEAGKIVFPDDYDFLNISRPVMRYFKDDDMAKAGENFGRIAVGTKLPDDVGMSLNGTKDISNLFGEKAFSFPKPSKLTQFLLGASTNSASLILDYFAGSGTTAHAVINLNREDKGNRQYILVEQGEYFDTVLKPRVQKVVYSKAWKDGKPVVEDKAESLQGVPQIVKVLKLESYEDTLNNLELRRSGLFDHLPENAQQDYLLNYMLNLESRGSLLNVSHFEKPFDYGLNISTTSAGAYDWQKVDLVETFNYLIGANIISVDDKRDEQGFVTIECRLPNQSADEKTLIFWRDCERVGYDSLQKQFDRLGINPADSEYSQVYVNGDHTLETVWDGEQSGSLKIISIEDAFLSLMFEGDA